MLFGIRYSLSRRIDAAGRMVRSVDQDKANNIVSKFMGEKNGRIEKVRTPFPI
jgi:hypothetical protein